MKIIEIQLEITANTKLKIGNLWPLICCQVEQGKKIHLKVSLLYCRKELDDTKKIQAKNATNTKLQIGNL